MVYGYLCNVYEVCKQNGEKKCNKITRCEKNFSEKMSTNFRKVKAVYDKNQN